MLKSFKNGLMAQGGSGIFAPGTSFFVKPYSGSNSNAGKTLATAKKTLAGVLAVMTADKQDVAYMIAESNTASLTTDYQSSTLDWNKDMTHLVGINSGSMLSQRSRVAFTSTYDTASNLFTCSADGCYIANIEFFEGVAGTNPTGCVLVSGQRNHFHNCHFAGIGNDANDIADAYSLRVTGSENLFTDCVIGLDTVSRGTADNSEIVFAGGAARNIFRNCLIITFAGANTHQFIKRAASASDRFNLFQNCTFINCVQSTGVSMTEALDVTAGGSPGGMIVLKDCSFFGVGDIEAATVSGAVYVHGAPVTAADNSLGGVTAAS